ncbi:hypothetical protein GCM10027268_02560 [Brachybacterium huguangmaarense]
MIVGFILWGVLAPLSVLSVSTAALTWVMTNLGWVFTCLAIGMVVFLLYLALYLALSRYGRIPLGLDGEEPVYSTASWAAMLFGAGIGIGIIFFGPFEPLTYYLAPRPGAYEAGSIDAITGAMAQAALHWGVNAWAIYAVVGLAIIALLTMGTIASAVSGVARGIRRLSNINMALAVALAVFVFVVGPTAFLANVIPGVIVAYLGSMPGMLSATMAQGPEMQTFLSSWTTFYWAWWVSWAPFVGVFTARISRGRTVRQFVIGVLTIPSSIIVFAFTIMGGTAIWLQRCASSLDETGATTGIAHPEIALAPDGTVDSLPPAPEIFFRMLDYFPGSAIITPIVMVMLAIFFITTADSASIVNSQLSQNGNPSPNRLITAFWAVCMAGIAVVILLAGGQNALQGLQNLITVTALPFAAIIVAMAVALYKEMRTDPLVIRAHYEETAIAKAVRHGVEEHGDDFALAIEPIDAAAGTPRAASSTPRRTTSRSGTRGATRTATSSTTTTAPPTRRGRGAARPRPTPRTGSMRGPDPHACAHPRGAPG